MQEDNKDETREGKKEFIGKKGRVKLNDKKIYIYIKQGIGNNKRMKDCK